MLLALSKFSSALYDVNGLKELTLQNLNPPAKMLVPVWKALCAFVDSNTLSASVLPQLHDPHKHAEQTEAVWTPDCTLNISSWRLWLLTAERSCFHTNDWRYRILLQRDSYFILKNSVTHLYLCPSCNSVLWIFKSIMYSTYSLWKNTVHISSSCSEIHVLAVRYTVKSLAGTPADIKK